MRGAEFSAHTLLALSASLAFSTSLAKEADLKVPHAAPDIALDDEISREALDRLKDTYLNIKRDARRKRGLAEEESVEELFERHRRRHERMGQQKRLHRLSDDERGSVSAAASRRNRGLPYSQLSGFIISGLSPGFASVDDNHERDPVFWCAGIDGDPLLKQPLVHRNLVEVLKRTSDDVDGAWEVIWDVAVFDNYTSTARLNVPGVDPLSMEVGKQKRKKHIYIDGRDDYDTDQLWDFRPGVGSIISDGDQYTQYNDRTWRPTHQLGKPSFCVESVLTHGTLKEYDTTRLTKCSKEKDARKTQVWIYCYEGEECTERDVVPPIYEISITCAGNNIQSTGGGQTEVFQPALDVLRGLSGRATSTTDDLNCYAHEEEGNVEDNAGDIPNDFYSLKTDCRIDNDDAFFDGDLLENTAHFVDTSYWGKGGAEMFFETQCDTDDSEDFELETLVRIYKIDENSDGVQKYDCVDSELLVCDEYDDEPRSIRTNVGGGSRYLVLTTGASTIRPCDIAEFDCQ